MGQSTVGLSRSAPPLAPAHSLKWCQSYLEWSGHSMDHKQTLDFSPSDLRALRCLVKTSSLSKAAWSSTNDLCSCPGYWSSVREQWSLHHWRYQDQTSARTDVWMALSESYKSVFTSQSTHSFELTFFTRSYAMRRISWVVRLNSLRFKSILRMWSFISITRSDGKTVVQEPRKITSGLRIWLCWPKQNHERVSIEQHNWKFLISTGLLLNATNKKQRE